jgi:hypothetical protein
MQVTPTLPRKLSTTSGIQKITDYKQTKPFEEFLTWHCPSSLARRLPDYLLLGSRINVVLVPGTTTICLSSLAYGLGDLP